MRQPIRVILVASLISVAILLFPLLASAAVISTPVATVHDWFPVQFQAQEYIVYSISNDGVFDDYNDLYMNITHAGQTLDCGLLEADSESGNAFWSNSNLGVTYNNSPRTWSVNPNRDLPWIGNNYVKWFQEAGFFYDAPSFCGIRTRQELAGWNVNLTRTQGYNWYALNGFQ